MFTTPPGHVGGRQDLAQRDRRQRRALARDHDRRVPADDRRGQPRRRDPSSAWSCGATIPTTPVGSGHREVEVRPGHRVRAAADLRDLVGPPRVPDPPVDRCRRRRGRGRRRRRRRAPPRTARGGPPSALPRGRGSGPGWRRWRRPTPAGRRGRPHGVAEVLARGLRREGQRPAVGGHDLVRTSRLATRERAADEQLRRATDGEALGAAHGLSSTYGSSPCRPPSRPNPLSGSRRTARPGRSG